MKIKYIIPCTSKMGSCEIVGTSNLMETAYENALWDYNSMRAHDGLPPIKRLPKGTESIRLNEE